MTNVLVTGGTGFIGSALVRRLARAGDRVLVLHRAQSEPLRLAPVLDRVQLHACELGEPSSWEPAVRRFAPERVFHLAWYAEPGKYLTDRAQNLEHLATGILLVEKLLELRPAQLCIAGTCFEYDTSHGTLREDHTPEKPSHIYSACKLALKNVALQLASDAQVPLSWARIFYLFGPYEDPRRLVPMIVNAVRAGKPIQLRSHGRQVRDFLHVDDVASGLDHATRLGRPGVVNVGSGVPITVRELALRVARVLGREDLISFASDATPLLEAPFVCADATRLRSLGWQPRVELDAAALRREEVS